MTLALYIPHAKPQQKIDLNRKLENYLITNVNTIVSFLLATFSLNEVPTPPSETFNFPNN